MAEPFIDGVTVPFSGHDRLEILNPADASVIDSVPEGGQAAVDAAVESALKAFPAWRDVPAAERGEILAATAHHLRQHIDELVRSLTSEQGKPLREARQEITRFILTLEHYVGLAKNIRGGYVPDLDKGAYGLIIRRPLGVIAAIVPWNFPTTLLGNKLGPALICGNTVVAKLAETTPVTTLRIDDMIKVGGNWVSPVDIENTLTEHPAVLEPAVVGVPVEGLTKVRAFVILREGYAPSDALVVELQEWCKSRLRRYQYPHMVSFVGDLPKTVTGKIQRFKLRQMHDAEIARAVGAQAVLDGEQIPKGGDR
jgi:hypothetical protein